MLIGKIIATDVACALRVSSQMCIRDRFGLAMLGQIPLDPAVAHACDAGQIETVDGSWLERAADLLEQLK